jgi:hypothetical protein
MVTKANSKPNPLNVKVWKIDVRPYQVQVGEDLKTGKPVMDDYDVKGSLSRLLFHPELKLTVDQAFQQKDLVDRIRAAGDFVIVDVFEMQRIRAAYGVLRSPDEQDLEFFRRIRDAEELEAGEVPAK